MEMAIRVLTVDDSILFRTVIKTEFAKIDDIDIIDTAANAAEAEEKIMRLNPDVVTMDVEMPGMNGIDFIRSFIPKKRVPFIVITSSPTRAFDAISAGAVEFITYRTHYMQTNSSGDWRPGGEAYWCPLVSIRGSYSIVWQRLDRSKLQSKHITKTG